MKTCEGQAHRAAKHPEFMKLVTLCKLRGGEVWQEKCDNCDMVVWKTYVLSGQDRLLKELRTKINKECNIAWP